MVGISLAYLAGAACAAGDYAAVQKRLGIPTTVATVVDASGSQPQYILIQDIHRHPEVQKNIAAAILYGLKHWGTLEIYVEGAWDERVAAVRTGDLQGPQMAIAMSGQDVRLVGLEDPDIYRKNVSAYEAVEKDREEALLELETARVLDRFADAGTQPWAMINRLIELKLKPGDYAGYQKNPFRPASKSILAGAVMSAERYYDLANERSGIFLKKANALHQSGRQVLVIGGFHTTAMAQDLRRQGISFAVLSPRVTQGGYEDLYAQGMHATISALQRR